MLGVVGAWVVGGMDGWMDGANELQVDCDDRRR